jgi:hypothetical protein
MKNMYCLCPKFKISFPPQNKYNFGERMYDELTKIALVVRMYRVRDVEIHVA